MAWPGEERERGGLTHLFEGSISCTGGVDDLLGELLFPSLEFVLQSQTMDFQCARQPDEEAFWCLDPEFFRQLLSQVPGTAFLLLQLCQ